MLAIGSVIIVVVVCKIIDIIRITLIEKPILYKLKKCKWHEKLQVLEKKRI